MLNQQLPFAQHKAANGNRGIPRLCQRRGSPQFLAVLVLFFAVVTPFTWAQIPVTDDAFTSSAAPGANYGISLGLVVQSPTANGTMLAPLETSGYTANTYLKFDLAALAPNLNAANLSKANLRLYVDFVVSPGSFDVYLVNGPWAEATLTANSAPNLGQLVVPAVQVSKALKYIDIDITPALAAWLNGTANNGLVLRPSTGSKIFASFDSKENPLTAHDPQLSAAGNDASASQLATEVTRATQAENTITTNLSSEVVRAEATETTITGNLNNEIARAKSAESGIGATVGNEASRAQSAEGVLTANLNTEVNNRIAGDVATLATANNYTNTNLLAEAAARTFADNTLQGNITALQNGLSGYAQLGTTNKFSADQTINGNLSANALNASGQVTAAGGALLPATQPATTSQGYPSNPLDLSASVSDGANAQNETFRWQSVPVNNGLPNFAAQLSLLYGGGVAPSSTGFSFNANGTANFAANQKFVGDGSGLRNVSAGTANTANFANNAGTASTANFATNAGAANTALVATTAANATNAQQLGGLSPGAFAQIATSNSFAGDQMVNGNLKLGSATNAIVFGDGTMQKTASTSLANTTVFCGTQISSSSPAAPPGYAPLGVTTAGNVWLPIPPDPTARAGMAATELNGKIYVFGGAENTQPGAVQLAFVGNPASSKVEVYDPAANTWTSETTMPNGRQLLSVAVLNGQIFAIGGLNLSNPGSSFLSSVDMFDPVQHTWSSVSPLTQPRFGHASAVVNGKIYAIGGTAFSAAQALNTVEVYDPAFGFWTQSAAPMPTAREFLAAAAINGKIFAIGGTAASGEVNTVEIYDPSANTWSIGAPMPTARTGLSATVVNGRIYVMGGGTGIDTTVGSLGGQSTSTFSKVEVYDPAIDAWSTAPDMPTSRELQTAASINGQIYEIGGLNFPAPGSNFQLLHTVEQYTPATLIYNFIKQ